MAVQDRPKITVEEFDRLVDLPENADRLFEYIGGEAIEVPSNPRVSEIAATIITAINVHLDQQGIDGHVTGEAGGYKISGERYAPDVAYISAARQPELAEQGYNSQPPELAVEVISPNDPEDKLATKVANYLAAGILIWLVRPKEKEVHVCAPGQPVRILGIDDTLDGGNVLPDLKLPVSKIFKRTK
jgi:Uma2 family endonuclease